MLSVPISQILSPDISYASPNMPLHQAIALLKLRDESLLLVKKAGQVIGILTRFDILKAIALQRDLSTHISELMSSPVICVPDDLDSLEAARIASHHRVRHLLVVKNDQLIGSVSERDFNLHLKLAHFIPMNQVKSLMDRSPLIVSTSTPVLSAIQKMLSEKKTAILFADDDSKPCGILTEYDILNLPTNPSLVSTPVISCSPKCSVIDAVELMNFHKTSHLVVAQSDDSICGVLSAQDLLKPIQRSASNHELRSVPTVLHSPSINTDFSKLIQSLGDGVWNWDLTKDEITWSDRSYSMLGYPPNAFSINFQKWSELVHPDDFALAQDIVANAIYGKQGFVIEFRYLCQDKTWLWVEGRGTVIKRDIDGKPTRITGIHSDISKRKATEEALLLSEQKLAEERSLFKTLYQAIPEMAWLKDPNGVYIVANTTYCNFHDLNESEIIGKTDSDIYPENSARFYKKIDQQVIQTGNNCQIEEWLTNKYNVRILVDVLKTKVVTENQELIGVLGVARDVGDQRYAIIMEQIQHVISEKLLDTDSQIEASTLLLQQALRLPEIDCGGIYGLDKESGDFKLLDHYGLSEKFVSASQTIDKHSKNAEIINAGETICSCINHDENSCCNYLDLIKRQHLRDEGLNTLLILPIKVNEKVVACLNLASHNHGHISDLTVHASKTLTSLFSNALQKREAQQLVRQQQNNLGDLFNSMQDMVFVVDKAGSILFCSQSVELMLGRTTDSLLQTQFTELFCENDQIQAKNLLSSAFHGKMQRSETPLTHRNGHSLLVETCYTQGFWNKTSVIYAISRNITQRIENDKKLRLAASVFHNAHEGIMITDDQQKIVEVNDIFTDLTGYSREDVLGKNPRMLNSNRQSAEFYQEMWEQLREKDFWRGEIWNRKKDGEVYAELLTISAVRDKNKQLTHYVAIFSDITRQKEHQKELESIAHFDPLTRLPNRVLLRDRFSQAIKHSLRNKSSLAVIYLDLDEFKPVNDRYGHKYGDQLLIELAQRLRSITREVDTIARLGGDEFIMLLSDVRSISECDLMLKRILSAAAAPFEIENHQIFVSASIGVTLFPDDDGDADTLLRHADQAMYIAKERGRNNYHLYDASRDREMLVYQNHLNQIAQALKKQQFKLYYQPQLDLIEGKLIGLEALIRWDNPNERRLCSPAEFLPIVEDHPLIIEIGLWTITQALRDLSLWNSAGLPLTVSVNIAPRQLQQIDFCEQLKQLLQQQPDVTANQLKLEVLESAALEDIPHVRSIIERCEQMDVLFALDDFGTGFSTLSYLKQLPAYQLKIDQSFVIDMLSDEGDAAIVCGVVNLAKAFGRTVIAEGVETDAHINALLRLGCQFAQGYGIAKPMPMEQIAPWLKQFQRPTSWSKVLG